MEHLESRCGYRTELSIFGLNTAGIIAITAMARGCFFEFHPRHNFPDQAPLQGVRRDRLSRAFCVDLILVAMRVAVGAYIFIDLNGPA